MDKQTYTIGDIHGELEKLKDCMSKVPLQKGDRLIFLGDYVDRGSDSYGVVEFLLKLKEEYECIFIRGNHDQCFLESLFSNFYNILWNQGGIETLQSYIDACAPEKNIIRKLSGYHTDFQFENFPKTHFKFFKDLLPYYIDENNNLFIHGGYNRHYLITNDVHNDLEVFLWDRDLWQSALSYGKMKNNTHPFKITGNYKEIYIGHTPTTYWDSKIPMIAANIINVDTGCGKGGELTIYNINTREFYQS